MWAVFIGSFWLTLLSLCAIEECQLVLGYLSPLGCNLYRWENGWNCRKMGYFYIMVVIFLSDGFQRSGCIISLGYWDYGTIRQSVADGMGAFSAWANRRIRRKMKISKVLLMTILIILVFVIFRCCPVSFILLYIRSFTGLVLVCEKMLVAFRFQLG